MTSFRSAAAYYSRYRVPYPKRLLAQLNVDANLGCDALVVDLATGPGRLGLALAPSVHEVVAVDVELEMLEEGMRAARGRGIDNVKWSRARAEDVSIPPGSVDLVTIGEAFHRLDQDLMLQRIRHWLKDGACVALVGCFGILHGDRPWQKSLRDALSTWVDGRTTDAPAVQRGKVYDTQRLVEAGFHGVANREFIHSHTWTRDSILGHLHSTSRFSLSALGDELEHFENAVLGALGPDEFGRFTQDISCGYSIGWTGQAWTPDAIPVASRRPARTFRKTWQGVYAYRSGAIRVP